MCSNGGGGGGGVCVGVGVGGSTTASAGGGELYRKTVYIRSRASNDLEIRKIIYDEEKEGVRAFEFFNSSARADGGDLCEPRAIFFFLPFLSFPLPFSLSLSLSYCFRRAAESERE